MKDVRYDTKFHRPNEERIYSKLGDIQQDEKPEREHKIKQIICVYIFWFKLQ